MIPIRHRLSPLLLIVESSVYLSQSLRGIAQSSPHSLLHMVYTDGFQMDTPYTLTKQGHELQFATNYLAPYIFTLTILPLILKSITRSIVNVSSSGHGNGMVRWDDPAFKGEGGYDKKQA